MSIFELRKENQRLIYQNRYLKSRLKKYEEIDHNLTDIQVAKKVINHYFGIDIDMPTRQEQIVRARGMYYNWLRVNTTLSLKGIADTLETRHDHSTLCHALSKHEAYYSIEKKYKRQYDEVCDLIKLEL